MKIFPAIFFDQFGSSLSKGAIDFLSLGDITVVVILQLLIVSDSAIPWTAACQAPLSFTIPWSLLRLTSTELMMPSTHLIFCCPLLLLPSMFPGIRVFYNELALCIRWPKSWSFSISPSSEYSRLISFRIDCFNFLTVKGLSRVFSSTTVWKHQSFSVQPSLWSNCHICTWLLERP